MPGAYRPAPPAAIVLLLLSGAATAGAEPPSATTSAAPDTVTATVRYVHPEAGGIEVIAGVQYALHLEYVRVTEETVIQRDEQSVALADLQPGELVRIDYEETEEGMVARSIHVIAQEEEGGAG